jgi:sulfopyruvate decarboxylase TPP-binding subunit
LSNDIPGGAGRADPGGWSAELFDLLRANEVVFFPYIPDAGNASLIGLVEQHRDTEAILLTTEEEGVAFCAGADLAGRRAALVMQSSGVGNCGNFLSLVNGARFPMLMIVTMRGDYGERNPWQYAMGQAVRGFLDTMGILQFRVDERSDLGKAATAAIAAAFDGGQGAALILSQRFLGAKTFA